MPSSKTLQPHWRGDHLYGLHKMIMNNLYKHRVSMYWFIQSSWKPFRWYTTRRKYTSDVALPSVSCFAPPPTRKQLFVSDFLSFRRVFILSDESPPNVLLKSIGGVGEESLELGSRVDTWLLAWNVLNFVFWKERVTPGLNQKVSWKYIRQRLLY